MGEVYREARDRLAILALLYPYPAMPLRPELTVDQLREIQVRRWNDADVRALLWEIRRLRCGLDRATSEVATLHRVLQARPVPPIVVCVRVLDAPSGALQARRTEGDRATIIGFDFDTKPISICVGDSARREDVVQQCRALAEWISSPPDRGIRETPKRRR